MLKGNSGFVADPEHGGVTHIAASYDADGHLFVDIGDCMWERMTEAEAREKELMHRVIECSRCSKAAVSLDHYWPYDSRMNFCQEHLDEYLATRKKSRRSK